ncbi:hypothetical protein AMI01nite_51910 [Aneurinibacillus migulanus]|nr:hypothetical protein AMI01nite_51910 [Aneurinibacillus migulanus]
MILVLQLRFTIELPPVAVKLISVVSDVGGVKCIFKKVEFLSSKQGKITKQDKAQVVHELRHEFPAKALLQLADIPRSTYYY